MGGTRYDGVQSLGPLIRGGWLAVRPDWGSVPE